MNKISRNRLLGAFGDERCWLCRQGQSSHRQGQSACAPSCDQGLAKAFWRAQLSRLHSFRIVARRSLPWWHPRDVASKRIAAPAVEPDPRPLCGSIRSLKQRPRCQSTTRWGATSFSDRHRSHTPAAPTAPWITYRFAAAKCSARCQSWRQRRRVFESSSAGFVILRSPLHAVISCIIEYVYYQLPFGKTNAKIGFDGCR